MAKKWDLEVRTCKCGCKRAFRCLKSSQNLYFSQRCKKEIGFGYPQAKENFYRLRDEERVVVKDILQIDEPFI